MHIATFDLQPNGRPIRDLWNGVYWTLINKLKKQNFHAYSFWFKK